MSSDGSYILCGDRHEAIGDQNIQVSSPVDGSIVGTVHEFSYDEIDKVIDYLISNQHSWAEMPLDSRSKSIELAASALEANVDELSDLLVMEIAKSKKDARDEVIRTADFMHHTAKEAKTIVGESQFSDAFARQNRNKLSVSYRVPLGVVLAIPPFNYPINLGLSKIAPALVTGNAVVLKPPTQGSVVCTRVVEILTESGIPSSALATVTGRGSKIGDYLVEHSGIDMISFTGSTEVGRDLAKKAGMVPLMLELGGKDAAIVLSDANLNSAATNIVGGAFSYSGQRCTAVKRVLASQDIADDLVKIMSKKISALSVGDPRDRCTITPLINLDAAIRAEELIQDAISKGAKLITGGSREGSLVQPTLLDFVTTDMDIAWVEPFAPVLPILRVKNAAEAVEISNQSEYGLQGAIFSRNIDAAILISMQLEVGTVQINGRTARGPDHFPFIGTKSSGMGAQGIHHSIEAMTRLKSMVFNFGESDLHNIS